MLALLPLRGKQALARDRRQDKEGFASIWAQLRSKTLSISCLFALLPFLCACLFAP
jgi:hypothetical protein